MRRFAAVWAVVALSCSLPIDAVAQDIDDLEDLDEGVVLETPFELGIEPNVWELTLNFGQVDYGQTLLEAQDIIVDVEDEVTAIFGDMTLEGQSSFSPQLRIGRTFGRHVALEASFGFAIGDFEQSATDLVKWIDPFGNNEFTDFERERGSYFVFTQDLGLLYYPRGGGRLQPYVIGAVGQNYWELDSNYVDGVASSLVYSYGAGLRIVADDLYSFRIEVRRYSTNVQYDQARTFVRVPTSDGDSLFDFPISRALTTEELAAIADNLGVDPADVVEVLLENGILPLDTYEGYDERSYDSLYISAGFTAAF